jgi:hypothetical protein
LEGTAIIRGILFWLYNEWSQQERDRDRGGRPSEKKKFGSIRLLAFILDGQLFA